VVPASALTLAGFRQWAASDDFPERGKISLHQQPGDCDMSQEEIETHGNVKGKITYTLYGLTRKGNWAGSFPTAP